MENKELDFKIDQILMNSMGGIDGRTSLSADEAAEAIIQTRSKGQALRLLNAYMNGYEPEPRKETTDPFDEVLGVLRFCLHHMNPGHKEIAISMLQRATNNNFEL